MWSCSRSVVIITDLEEPIGVFCVRFNNLKGNIFHMRRTEQVQTRHCVKRGTEDGFPKSL